MTPTVSILIVAYECRDALRACLRSIEDTTDAATTEVIVVDNASTDGTVEMVRSEFPAVRLFPLAGNVGFARGVNCAASHATGEFLLLLNPDTVVHPGTVDRLIQFARAEPGYGLYGGRTVWPDGSLCPTSCRSKPSLWSVFCFATLLSAAFKGSPLFDPEELGRWRRDSVRVVGVLTGCLVLVERTIWKRLGGFDERFFMYGEDVDLSLRAWELGYRPVFVPDAVITHALGGSSASRPERKVLVMKGKATVVRKHFGPGRRQAGLALLWAGVGLRAALGPIVRALPGVRRDAGVWGPVWRARREWLRGYELPSDDGPVLAEELANAAEVNPRPVEVGARTGETE